MQWKMVRGFLHKCDLQSWRWLWFLVALLMGIGMLLYKPGFDLSPYVKTNVEPALNPDNTSTADEQFYVPYPHPYPLIIDQPVRCQQGAPFLVLMVPVAPSDKTSRHAIRSSWGGLRSVRGREVQVYFLLGSIAPGNKMKPNQAVQNQILKESQLFHDIIQNDFVDSYGNLTVKTMLMFEWLRSHCPNSSYAMKIDSDIFLNVPNLIDLLLYAPRRSYVTGQVHHYSEVIRDTRSKWYMPYSIYPKSHYPPYALGLGYAFSMDLPGRILEASARIKAFYIEDVYVGLCLQELGVKPSDSSHLFRAALPPLMPHCYWTDIITTMLKNSKVLLETWKKYQMQLNYC